MSAARAFANEIIIDLSEPIEAQSRRKTNEQAIDIEADKTEVRTRIVLTQETETPRETEALHKIEVPRITERGVSR